MPWCVLDMSWRINKCRQCVPSLNAINSGYGIMEHNPGYDQITTLETSSRLPNKRGASEQMASWLSTWNHISAAVLNCNLPVVSNVAYGMITVDLEISSSEEKKKVYPSRNLRLWPLSSQMSSQSLIPKADRLFILPLSCTL